MDFGLHANAFQLFVCLLGDRSHAKPPLATSFPASGNVLAVAQSGKTGWNMLNAPKSVADPVRHIRAWSVTKVEIHMRLPIFVLGGTARYFSEPGVSLPQTRRSFRKAEERQVRLRRTESRYVCACHWRYAAAAISKRESPGSFAHEGGSGPVHLDIVSCKNLPIKQTTILFPVYIRRQARSVKYFTPRPIRHQTYFWHRLCGPFPRSFADNVRVP